MAEYIDIEIDQETQAETGQFQIRQYLSTVNRQHLRERLYLDDHGLLYQNVEAISTIQIETSILHRQGNLWLVLNSPQIQLSAQTRFIGRLQKARSEPPVHFDRRTHDVVSAAAR